MAYDTGMYSRLCIAAGAGHARRPRAVRGDAEVGRCPRRLGDVTRWRSLALGETSEPHVDICSGNGTVCLSAVGGLGSGRRRGWGEGGSGGCPIQRSATVTTSRRWRRVSVLRRTRSRYDKSRRGLASCLWRRTRWVSGRGLVSRGPVGNHALDFLTDAEYHGGLTSSLTGRGAARLARLLWEQEVGGSNPLAPTRARL